ncbi:MAG: hypothetical protein ACLFM1_07550 [Bacteroidales bacterium]
MKHLRNLFITLIILGSIVITHSCIKDSFDFDKLTNEVHWEPSLAAPIAFGSLEMVDGLNAYDSVGRLQINEDGYLSLMYFEAAESDTVSEIMDIGNQQLQKTISSSDIDFSGFGSGDQMTVNYTYDLEFDLFNPDAEIDSIWLDHGKLSLAAVSTYQHAIELILRFPTVTKNGSAFTDTLNLLPYGSSDQSLDNSVVGYHVDLTQTALGYNEIPVEVSMTIIHSGGDNSGSLELQADLLEPDHEAMFGYFGHNTLIYESGKINIDLFDPGDEWEIDDFWFEDPKFKVNYRNSYGIPTNFYFDSVIAYSSYYNQHYNILDYGAGLPMDSLDPYNMTYTSQFGTFVEDSLELNHDNSNIREVIQQRPAWVKFIAHAHTNPGGEASHENFVWDDSRFIADVQVELPLWGYIDRFHGLDTTDLNLEEEFEDPGMIKRLMLRLNIDNGLPVEALAQAYFMDEDHVILDSIIKDPDNRILKSAEIDNDGKVISKSMQSTEISVTGEMLDKIMSTKYLLYKASASTTNASEDELIKVFPEYGVDFNIAVEADLDVEIDLDTLNTEEE